MFLFIIRWIITIIIAFFIGKLVSKLKLPSILGWLIAGMILGPHALSILDNTILEAGWYENIVHILECVVGLMIGTEFVNPKAEKDCIGSLPSSGEIAAQVQKLCFENGLIVEKGGRFGSVMRCLCALNISDEDLNKAWKIFENAVITVDKQI